LQFKKVSHKFSFDQTKISLFSWFRNDLKEAIFKKKNKADHNFPIYNSHLNRVNDFDTTFFVI